jgi:transposase
MGPIRGGYNKFDDAVKLRIIKEADNGGDWVAVADANGVPYKTAHHWLTTGCQVSKRRGGNKGAKKLSENQVATVTAWLEDDCQLTLMEIRDRIEVEMDVSITPQTVAKYLDGQTFTSKLVHRMPQGMNTTANKQLRCEYVRSVMEFAALRKSLIFIDETNFNLFCRRSKGRSRRGTRAVVKLPNSKGPNIHIIGGMTPAGDLFWERRRGAFRTPQFEEWIRRCFAFLMERGHPPQNIVVVLDNAPVHSHVERVLTEPQYAGATPLRLAPYSSVLNPIEHIWSSVKSHIRGFMREHFQELLAGDPNGILTCTEFRLRYLEIAADQAMAQLTPAMCKNAYRHVHQRYPAALDLQDMPVGI